MKKLITFILFLACFAASQAQSFEYIITPYGPLFSLDILEISENQRDTTISRKGQLDTASVQAVMYGNVRQAYNRIATLEREIDRLYQERNANLRALNAVDINDYFIFERDRVRRSLNGRWAVVFNGQRYICDVENNNGVLRTAANDNSGLPENTLIGVMVPRSRKFFVVNLDADIEENIGENIDVFSSDADTFMGEDSSGNRLVLRIIQQTN